MPSLAESSPRYEVVYRKIRYPRLEFKTGTLLLILPEGASEEEILTKYASWIEEKSAIIEEALQKSQDKELYNRSDVAFKGLIYNLINNYSDDLGKKPAHVFFRRMNSKWASCSKSGNITVNLLLKYLPDRAVAYVIYHEMLHLFEKRHNAIFWRKISGKYPDWEDLEKDLFIYWFAVQKLVTGE